ncbi:MAG: HDOD domain-containing protein [Giesbergeria sp.]|nr:HDOD domain-containing protein [Giesbergeria sp.]
MAALQLTCESVLAQLDALPAFPRTVQRILATVDDPESSMTDLANLVSHDPAIAARVYAAAHKAAAARDSSVVNLYAATSLIGMQAVREIALYFSMSSFFEELTDDLAQGALWHHSVAVGVCAQELACHISTKVSVHHAFIAGLLHDIGQFWLLRHSAQASNACWRQCREKGIDICQAEESMFGVNHAVLGTWLVEAWGLPASIASAVKGHHRPDAVKEVQPLVNLVHVAEVLSNALELNGHTNVHVSYLSSRACHALGLTWDTSIHPLFGRIEARAEYMGSLLEP